MVTILEKIDKQEIEKVLASDARMVMLLDNRDYGAVGVQFEDEAEDGLTPSVYWERLCAEFRKLVCDQNAYPEIRQSVEEAAGAGKFIGLPMLCTVIGTKVGLPEALVTPYIAFLLHMTFAVGVRAWCGSENFPDFTEKK